MSKTTAEKVREACAMVCRDHAEICVDAGSGEKALTAATLADMIGMLDLSAFEEEARDAERYQWLREKSSRQSMTGKKHSGQIQVIQWADRTEANVLTYAALDVAIDAALKGDAHD